MSTSAFEYRYIEDVECLEDYKLGGYHPIQLDERIHKRYRITSKYVAIKVGTADAEKREVDILTKLAEGARAAASSHVAEQASLIPLAVDRFSIDGPNGTHPCFVTAPARCSLMGAKDAAGSRLLQLDVARSLAAQLAMAVSYVHSQGYAHGDLHLSNTLLKLPSSLNDLSVEQLYAQFGAPERVPVLLSDGAPPSAPGVPTYAVPPVWLGIASNKILLKDARLLLSDFGVAFSPSDKACFESQTPLVIRPPEAFFEPTTPLSFPSDMWSLGCAIFELFAHRSLIDGILAPPGEITAQQVHLQGSLPSEWWNRWEERSKWFDEAGKALSNERDVWGWDRRFEQWIQEPRRSYGMKVICEEERAALLEMLHWMLAWQPDDRPTATQVLDTTWMKRWALPAYKQGQPA